MKKISIIFLSVILVLTVGACSSTPSPTKVVDAFFKELMKDPFATYNDDLNLGNSSEEEIALYNQFSEMLKKQTYTLDNEKIDGEKATVDVHMKTYDYTKSFGNAIADYFGQAISAAFSGADEETLNKMLYKIWTEKLVEDAENGLTKSFDYTVKLNKTDGKWVMEDLSKNEAFVDGFIGGLLSALEQLGNE